MNRNINTDVLHVFKLFGFVIFADKCMNVKCKKLMTKGDSQTINTSRL